MPGDLFTAQSAAAIRSLSCGLPEVDHIKIFFVLIHLDQQLQSELKLLNVTRSWWQLAGI